MSSSAPPPNGRPSRYRRGRRPGPPQQPRPAPYSTSGPVQSAVAVAAAKPAAPPRPDSPRAAYYSEVKFQDFVDRGLLIPELKARIPFEQCTVVQAETLEPILKGEDVFGQAKTGTGKTLAFLVPALQKVFKNPPSSRDISILVLSPTRELALQIEAEVQKLLVGTSFRAAHAIGGTNPRAEARALSERVDVLVATPGRMADHLKTTDLKQRFSNLQTFILDEADRLLDDGFKPQLMEIIGHLPRAPNWNIPRQTLMFSATVNKEVLKIAQASLRPNYKFITTIGEHEDNTHQHIDQSFLVCPAEDQFAVTLHLLRRAFASNPQSKIIIFYATARGAAIAYDVFRAVKDLQAPVFEIHSRLSQPQRERMKKGFMESQHGGVLCSSDVSARGLDVPGITAVYQVGIASSAEQYVHRVGRTGRAGSEVDGHGVLILADFERPFLEQRDVAALPLKRHPDQDLVLSMSSPELQSAKQTVNEALLNMDALTKSQAYTAFLGFYNGSLRMLKLDKKQLIELANAYAFNTLLYPRTNGQLIPPPITKKAVGMMGLKGLPGLNAVAQV